MSASLHISISAEEVTRIGSLSVSNSIITSLIVSFLMVTFFVLVKMSLDPKAKKLKKLQNIAEFLVEGFHNLIQGVTSDEKKTRFLTPIFMSFFLFILANNWFGLIPGVGTIGFYEKVERESVQEVVLLQKNISIPVSQVQASEEVVSELVVEGSVAEAGEVVETSEHAEESTESDEIFIPYFRPGTADLNTTIALALISVFFTQFVGIKYLGLGYFKKFLNFSSPIMFFVGVLEIISEFVKIISFAFRLFGNIFAGEVLLVVIGSLIPLIGPMPFYALEVFVGVIQALVFSLLSLVFFNMATLSHDDH